MRGAARRGDEVVCLDNFLTGTPENVGAPDGRPCFTLDRCDLTDFVHVPGRSTWCCTSPPGLTARLPPLPIETLKVGSVGTLHALGLAKDKGARFLLASTSEVYGDPQVHPQPEDYWGTSTRSGLAGSTTRRSGSPRR